MAITKPKYGSLEAMFEKAGLSPTTKFDKDVFMDDIIITLGMDEDAGEIIFNKISEDDFCRLNDFLELVYSIDPSYKVKIEIPPKEEVKKEIPKKEEKLFDPEEFTSVLENNHPLFDIFNHLDFNEKGNLISDLFRIPTERITRRHRKGTMA